MPKATYVLGTGLSHNGSACLLRDGQIIAAVEKERVTGKKNDGGNDLVTIAHCLETAGIGPEDLDLIVQNANFGDFHYGNNWYRGARQLPAGVPVVTISHHLAHATAAYFLSPFDNASVLVVDGCGSPYDECTDLAGSFIAERPPEEVPWLWCEKDSFYSAAGGRLRALYKDFSPWGRPYQSRHLLHPPTTRHSIGGQYMSASHYCLGGTSDMGKLMGLAPYGKANPGEPPIFRSQDGRVFVDEEWVRDYGAPFTGEGDFKNRFQYFADLARRVQTQVEESLLYLVRHRHRLADHPDLCFAGGVALNAVANRRILEETPICRLFVPPAADDSGLAIGCAFHGWAQVLGGPRVRHDGGTFFGRAYGEPAILRALSGLGDGVSVRRPTDLVGDVADLLAGGSAVAWFQGGAEFGPRALGHRSILGDPRRADLRDYINLKVKFREDFRPFAPSVLAEEAGRYFELEGESPYMLLVVRVREEWHSRIPAVTHVDGTARVQTVTPRTDARYHALLTEFGRRTGLGMLLNTSLNRRGSPMVETPAQAVTMFRETGLHALAIGDWLVTKTGVGTGNPAPQS
ncbi:transferase [Niveispirillum sp. SYP-B3756]|nr:transferase [Niveispirillum sp. SYP-B3756]